MSKTFLELILANSLCIFSLFAVCFVFQKATGASVFSYFHNYLVTKQKQRLPICLATLENSAPFLKNDNF